VARNNTLLRYTRDIAKPACVRSHSSKRGA
jgi:hypothetical protein